MKKTKKLITTLLLFSICILVFAGCNGNGQRGPLDVKKVTYVVHSGDVHHVEVTIITSDRKVTQYSINPKTNESYNYLEGELPPEDCYTVTEFEMSELSWSSMVNVLTRVNFMELKEDLSTTETVYDGSTSYIKVETADAVHTSGGYAAGVSNNSDNKRYAEARQYIINALKEK